MRKRIFNILKYLFLAAVFAVLTVIFFRMEHGSAAPRRKKYHLTVGAGMLTVVFLCACVSCFRGKVGRDRYRFVVEDVFAMKSGGCVAAGVVAGTMEVGDRVEVHAQSGNVIRTKIRGIEVRGQAAPGAADTAAAVWLKNVEAEELKPGDVIVYGGK